MQREMDGGAKQREGRGGRAPDVCSSVIRYHPVFAPHSQRVAAALLFMSELITGRQGDGDASCQISGWRMGLRHSDVLSTPLGCQIRGRLNYAGQSSQRRLTFCLCPRIIASLGSAFPHCAMPGRSTQCILVSA